MRSVFVFFVMTVCVLAASNSPTVTSVELSLQQAMLLESDSDRGCCLLRTKDTSCAYANRKYCRTKAEEAGVRFEFYKDTACKNVSECVVAQ